MPASARPSLVTSFTAAGAIAACAAVAADGTQAAAAAQCIGFAQNAAGAGERCSVVVAGSAIAIANGPIGAFAPVAVAAGGMISPAIGAGVTVGVALTAATAAGDRVEVLVGGSQSLAGGVTSVTASRALTSADNGTVLLCNSASTLYLTDPGTLGAGFSCSVVQIGAGTVVVIGAPDSATITAPPSGSLIVKDNLAAAIFGSGIAAVNVQSILTAIGATVWLPGIGELNFGFTNAAYSDAAATTLAVANGPVRSLRAGRNTANVAVPASGSPMTTPPNLVRNATTGAYYVDFGVSNADAYAPSTPQAFTNRINPIMVLVVAAITASSGRTINSMRWNTGSSDRFCINTMSSTNIVQARGNGFTLTSAVALTSTPQVMSFRQSGASARNLRQNGVETVADTTTISSAPVAGLTSHLIGAESVGATGAITAGSEWRGPLYAVVTAPASPSDADMLVLERFFGSLAGIAIP